MKFEIKDIVINETGSRKNTYLTRETPIYFSTPEDYTTGGTCVIVDTDDRSFFNITCKKSTTFSTEQSQSTTTRKATGSSTSTTTKKPTVTSISTGKVITLSISSSSKGVTEANSNTGPDEETRQVNHIIPLVTAISGIVCLAIVIAVIIFCKRRKTRNRPMVNSSKSTAEQEQENNYYMTENPMYNVNVIETQPDAEHTENVYHYIEHNQLDSRRQTVQYESLPDSPVGKHLPTNVSKHNQNYDYTTCQEIEYVAGNTNKLDTGNETGKMSSEKVDAGEIMYDRTDKAAVNQFSGMNEYHHLRPDGSSEKFVLDTYDTIGKVGEKEEEQKEPEYDVTHSR
ncbi:uncharacterized protein LOC123553613 isoform X2 [Mercenaria mercenaria]|nr:uncharacterized protein LOC123553613 isoform X2 [Mercenaria mercenaria]XP_053397988.1 uncharacterized protein LOC123553613 isoform X2 [Mercenaria mercenaria]